MKVSFEKVYNEKNELDIIIEFESDDPRENAKLIFELISAESYLFEPIALAIKEQHPQVFQKLRVLFKKSAPIVDSERVLQNE